MTIGGIHEDIVLVKTSDRAASTVPKSEQQADSRERLFAARQA